MSKRLYGIISKVMDVPISEINDESSPESIESWDSFNSYVLLDELETEFKTEFSIDEVVETKNEYCLAKVITGGNIGSNKAISINKIINLPSITEKDEVAIQIGKEMGVRNFALSFSGSLNDVKSFRNLTGPEAVIISKIESLKGLSNLDEIIKESDEILIDRGDLSREVRIEKIPFLQRTNRVIQS